MKTIRILGLAAALAAVFLLSTLPAAADPITGDRYTGDITGCDNPPCGTVEFRVSEDGLLVQNFIAYDIDGVGCYFVGRQEYPGDLAIVGDSFGPGTLDWYQVSGSFSSEGDALGTFRLAPHPPGEPPPCDTGPLYWTAGVWPVGGIAELPEGTGSSVATYIPLAGVAAAALVALAAGRRHARRRPLR